MGVNQAVYAIIYFGVEFIKLYLIGFVIFCCKAKKRSVAAVSFAAGTVCCILLDIIPAFQPGIGFWRGMLVLVGSFAILEKKRQIPILFACFTGISMIDSLIFGVACLSLDIDRNMLRADWALTQLLNSISFLLFALTAFCIFLVRSNNGQDHEIEYNNRVLRNVTVISTGLLFVGCYMVLAEKNALSSHKYPAFQLLGLYVIGGLILTFCVVYIYLIKQHEKHKLRIEYYANMMRQEKSYYSNLKQAETNTRKMRHDMKSHLGLIQSLLEMGDISGAENYLRKLNKNLAEQRIHYTGNLIADMAINDIMNRFEEVEIKCKGSMPGDIKMEDVDLCILFSNLISNAAEAAESTEEKCIILELGMMERMLTIRMCNAYTGKRKFMDGKPVSTKADKMVHGFGVGNMTDVVCKYGGQIQFHAKEQFVVEIMIQNVL